MSFVYRTGEKLGTTIYLDGETQPCGWFPNKPGLAFQVVNLLNNRDLDTRLRAAVLEWARTYDLTKAVNLGCGHVANADALLALAKELEAKC